MIGPLLTIGSALLGHELASQRQSNAQDFSADQFANRYQTTTADMKKAGLNPMLAYSQGGGSPPSSSAASANTPDVGASFIQSKLNAAQVANIEADTQNKNEQSALIRAQTAQASSSASMADANITKIGQEVMNLKEQFKNIPLEGKRLEAMANQLAYSANLMLEQGISQDVIRSHLSTMIKKLKSETKLLDLDVKAAESTDNVGRETGQLKPFFDIISGILEK